MSQVLILSFIANDRPGLVEKIAETVTSAGGNWLESRMAHLAEKFAGVARIVVDDAQAEALKSALEALDAEGIHLTVETAREQDVQDGIHLTLDLVGPDHPGIVQDIAHCLTASGASIEEMESDIREAPMGGGKLFYAKLKIRGPLDLDEEKLQQELERLSALLMIDITLREEILSTQNH